jgi:hypothetical protein
LNSAGEETYSLVMIKVRREFKSLTFGVQKLNFSSARQFWRAKGFSLFKSLENKEMERGYTKETK